MPNKQTYHSNFTALKYRAKNKLKCPFELSWPEFMEIVVHECRYCGDTENNSIDRLDNSIGYLKGNLVPCCKICNDMKKAHSEDFFIAHIRNVWRHTAGFNIKLNAKPTEWRNLRRSEDEQQDNQLPLDLPETETGPTADAEILLRVPPGEQHSIPETSRPDKGT